MVSTAISYRIKITYFGIFYKVLMLEYICQNKNTIDPLLKLTYLKCNFY